MFFAATIADVLPWRSEAELRTGCLELLQKLPRDQRRPILSGLAQALGCIRSGKTYQDLIDATIDYIWAYVTLGEMIVIRGVTNRN